MKHLLQFLISVFFSLPTLAQDSIFMKDGSIIAAKVTEITPDWIKYKNWLYKEGPTYYESRFDVLFIKYPNGSKDEFTTKVTEEKNPKKEIEITEPVIDKFSGEWYPANYNGTTIKTRLTIRQMKDDYLVAYMFNEQVDTTIITTGSFKELGKLNNYSLELNNQLKLSLIDDAYLLMNSIDFFRKEELQGNITREIAKCKEQVKTLQKEVAELDKEIVALNKNLATKTASDISAATIQIRAKSKQLADAEKRLDEMNQKLAQELKRAASIKFD